MGFGDFSMERVDMVLGSLVPGVGIDARTAQSLANREAIPNHVAARVAPPADTHSNASFAAEVQSVSEAATPLRDLS